MGTRHWQFPIASITPPGMLIPCRDTHYYGVRLGEGPPLVCLHGGFGLDHTYFRPALDPLACAAQLLYLDLRGQGRSPIDAAWTFSLETLVEDLEAIRREYGWDRWSLLGHSGGGLLAAAYASRYPGQCQSLIVVSSFPYYPFEAPEWFAKIRELDDPEINSGVEMFLAGLTNDADYREAFLKIAPLFFADPCHADCTPFSRVIYRVRPYLESTGSATRIHCGEALRGFTRPVLAIHGSHDYRVPKALATAWRTYVPQMAYVELPQTGHFPFLEAPTDFVDVVAKFLRKRD
ncbi:MAG: alpha/beta hydrolase [Deltaproteobacteria bacterium]|nr:alpha/beta hydrolase [Deltaproteobacteria bacterium]